MKTNQIFGAFAISVISMGCYNKEKSTKPLEALKSDIETTNTTVTYKSNDIVNDSISKLESQINTLQDSKMNKQEEISFLLKQKDALKSALDQIIKSQQQVGEKKIDSNINSVSAKLDALKNQHEQIVEDLALKRKEVKLAEKKIALWQEEKEVYDTQRKSLYAKGASPDEFKIVDSLLVGINGKIRSQIKADALLKRSIDDMEEQRSAIDLQRSSLSDKIRDNYSAKQIFDDFATEEKQRLNDKLIAVESALEDLLNEVKSTNERLIMNTSRKSAFENERELIAEKAKADEPLTAESEPLVVQQREIVNPRNRIMAFISVGVLGSILALFYFLGRKKNKL